MYEEGVFLFRDKWCSFRFIFVSYHLLDKPNKGFIEDALRDQNIES